MKRIDLWRKPFDETLDAIKATPFDWDGNECVTGLAVKTTLAITGEDFGAEHRGKYHDEESAKAYLQSLGFEDLASLVASILPEIPVAQAEIGDIVAIPVATQFGHVLGVVNGERVFVLTPRGVGTVALTSADRAFKVG